MAPSERVRDLAELAVVFGADLQPGQILAVSAEPAHAELVHAIAEVAYRREARYVDVTYRDPWVTRSRIEHAPDDTLEFVPPWVGQRLLGLGEERSASVGITGAEAPGLLDDLDPVRVGRGQFPFLEEARRVMSERLLNWTAVPCATPAWARRVYPELEEEAALERLWDAVAHVCRLDEPDPVAAWERRMGETGRVAAALTERRFDALHLHGGGTDLTLGLLPSSRWITIAFQTADGIPHRPNIPSEEVFTTPDPERADGVVRASRPLALGSAVLTDFEVRFAGGRAVEFSGDRVEALEAAVSVDEGGRRLGEIALVDREGRVGGTGTVFYNVLLDENAASHLALGHGFPFAVDEADVSRVNRSKAHVDFMIGSDHVDVTGVTRDGQRVPVLRSGSWQL